jgi:hypothetical protein
MVDPQSAPLLFDTSAESWLARTQSFEALSWIRKYLSHHQVNISAATVIERVRGYSLLWLRSEGARREHVEAIRIAYLGGLGRVWPIDEAIAVVAAEISALLPDPPTPARHSHRVAESRQERLVRWRFGAPSNAHLNASPTLVH